MVLAIFLGIYVKIFTDDNNLRHFIEKLTVGLRAKCEM